jgi:hypothetical protein
MNNFLIKIIMNLIKRLTKNVMKKLYLLLGDILISNSRKQYDSYKTLEEAEIKIFSQNGEDGIIDYLIKKIEINKPNFVEIGVGDYTEANTRNLYEKYYGKGLIVDVIQNFREKVLSNVSIWRGNLNILQKNINSKNINEILNSNVDFDIDIFSIDIDGIDYWVLNQIKPKISKVVILEYNSIFGSKKELTIPNIDNFDRTKAHYSNLYYGASLKSYVSLMNKKGYYLLGVNRLRNNAFFVNEDFPKTKYFQNINTMSLAESTKFNFSESRDIKGNLNYLNNKKKIEEIHNCEVINLQIDKTSLYKIKDVI